MGTGDGGGKKRRSYRPAVEALEAFRLLSVATQLLPDLAVERDVMSTASALEAVAPSASDATWDAALGQTQLADILSSSQTQADSSTVASGLSQLNRYLSRAWYRAGIPVQLHDDSTQAVYVTLLQNLGRSRFDALVSEIGSLGIRDVLSRETDEGPDFFRAIDTVKKRAQRERSFQPLETVAATATSAHDGAQAERRDALHEAIDQSLTPREAALIQATLKGETPAEIAAQWGVAPKTVSNEKTRALQKLREALVADPSD